MNKNNYLKLLLILCIIWIITVIINEIISITYLINTNELTDQFKAYLARISEANNDIDDDSAKLVALSVGEWRSALLSNRILFAFIFLLIGLLWVSVYQTFKKNEKFKYLKPFILSIVLLVVTTNNYGIIINLGYTNNAEDVRNQLNWVVESIQTISAALGFILIVWFITKTSGGKLPFNKEDIPKVPEKPKFKRY